MGKYIDAEKLITIIEERKNQQDQWVNRYHDPINQGISNELIEILDIITSLQEEQTQIEREAEISPSMVSNFGPCAFNFFVTLTQEEMEKMNIAPFITKKANIIIKDAK